MDKLQDLARALQITSGLGQDEIWTLFRDGTLIGLQDVIPQDLLQAVDAVEDCGA